MISGGENVVLKMNTNDLYFQTMCPMRCYNDGNNSTVLRILFIVDDVKFNSKRHENMLK